MWSYMQQNSNVWFVCKMAGGRNDYLNGTPDPIKEREENRQLARQTTLQTFKKKGFVALKTKKNGLN